MGMLKELIGKKQEEHKRMMAELEKELCLEKKRMYATERENFLRLHMAKDIAFGLVRDIGERLDMAGVKENVNSAALLLEGALTRVYLTAPDDQRETLDRNAEAVTYAIGVKTPGSVGARNGDKNWGMYISFNDAGIMVGAAKDHCLTCTGSPQEQKSCELRAVFDRMGVDADHVRGECGYRELI